MDLSPTNTIRTTGSTSPPDPVFKLASYDSSLNSRIAMTFPVTRDPVHAMALSIDGKLLAIGNDAGRLEVSPIFPQDRFKCSCTCCEYYLHF